MNLKPGDWDQYPDDEPVTESVTDVASSHATPVSARGWRRGRAYALLLLMLAIPLLGWLSRGSLLAGLADLLVSEDPVEQTDWLVLSGASARATSLEGVHLYHEAVAQRVLVVTWKEEPLQERIVALGIPQPTANELIGLVLDEGGVPSSSVTLVPSAVDGTELELRVVAEFVRRHGITSLLYVTTRTHTARSRYLLSRQVPRGVRVLVRASRYDPFEATAWWHSRDQARDVMAEYLRWVNSFLLADLWQPQPA